MTDFIRWALDHDNIFVSLSLMLIVVIICLVLLVVTLATLVKEPAAGLFLIAIYAFWMWTKYQQENE